MSVRLIPMLLILLPVAVVTSTAAGYAQEPANPAAAVLERHIMVTPAEIQWGRCPPVIPAGAQCAVLEGNLAASDRLFSYRLKMPSGFRFAPHFHPADEHLFVVEGTFHLGLGEAFHSDEAKPMVAGSFMVMPKGTPHFGWTEGETILQVYAIGPWNLIYVNPEDDPRNRR